MESILKFQRDFFEHGVDQHLLLLEHPHVFTYGPNADLANNLRCDPHQVGAELVVACGDTHELAFGLGDS